MRKCRTWLWGLLAFLLLIFVGQHLFTYLFLREPLPHQIDRNGFEKIMAGMEEQEVEAVILVPAGDYRTRRVSYGRPDGGRPDYYFKRYSPSGSYKEWKGDKYLIQVGFDAEGKVSSKELKVAHVAQVGSPTFWQKVRRWLGG